MTSGWRYRVASVGGVVSLVLVALAIANDPIIEAAFRWLPIVGHLPLEHRAGGGVLETTTTVLVILGVLIPLYKPRPRRILDIWVFATKRTIVSMFALATIGYFDLSFRLPRGTLLITGSLLLMTIPAWFILIRRRPKSGDADRTVIIGDDPDTMADIYRAVDGYVLGYVSPPTANVALNNRSTEQLEYADGGMTALTELPCLGGLSRLNEVLVEYDIGTAVLAFSHPDRAEFFGALDTCYEHGVAAKVHRDHANLVLTPAVASGELVDIDLEPWDTQDHITKRLFDIAFAGAGLIVLLPVMTAIAVAIKIDDGGPVFYSQKRTASFGDTFTIYKFRTMDVGSEQSEPGEDENRITDLGRFLRTTHLDEIPQLWSILVGRMSVVGPRAVWTDEEKHLESVAENWRKRWFVKPGLTGLAQINGASSTDPETKLRYDIEYIRKQSFSFDMKIVLRQVWTIGQDLVSSRS